MFFSLQLTFYLYLIPKIIIKNRNSTNNNPKIQKMYHQPTPTLESLFLSTFTTIYPISHQILIQCNRGSIHNVQKYFNVNNAAAHEIKIEEDDNVNNIDVDSGYRNDCGSNSISVSMGVNEKKYKSNYSNMMVRIWSNTVYSNQTHSKQLVYHGLCSEQVQAYLNQYIHGKFTQQINKQSIKSPLSTPLSRPTHTKYQIKMNYEPVLQLKLDRIFLSKIVTNQQSEQQQQLQLQQIQKLKYSRGHGKSRKCYGSSCKRQPIRIQRQLSVYQVREGGRRCQCCNLLSKSRDRVTDRNQDGDRKSTKKCRAKSKDNLHILRNIGKVGTNWSSNQKQNILQSKITQRRQSKFRSMNNVNDDILVDNGDKNDNFNNVLMKNNNNNNNDCQKINQFMKNDQKNYRLPQKNSYELFQSNLTVKIKKQINKFQPSHKQEQQTQHLSSQQNTKIENMNKINNYQENNVLSPLNTQNNHNNNNNTNNNKPTKICSKPNHKYTKSILIQSSNNNNNNNNQQYNEQQNNDNNYRHHTAHHYSSSINQKQVLKNYNCNRNVDGDGDQNCDGDYNMSQIQIDSKVTIIDNYVTAVNDNKQNRLNQNGNWKDNLNQKQKENEKEKENGKENGKFNNKFDCHNNNNNNININNNNNNGNKPIRISLLKTQRVSNAVSTPTTTSKHIDCGNRIGNSKINGNTNSNINSNINNNRRNMIVAKKQQITRQVNNNQKYIKKNDKFISRSSNSSCYRPGTSTNTKKIEITSTNSKSNSKQLTNKSTFLSNAPYLIEQNNINSNKNIKQNHNINSRNKISIINLSQIQNNNINNINPIQLKTNIQHNYRINIKALLLSATTSTKMMKFGQCGMMENNLDENNNNKQVRTNAYASAKNNGGDLERNMKHGQIYKIKRVSQNYSRHSKNKNSNNRYYQSQRQRQRQGLRQRQRQKPQAQQKYQQQQNIPKHQYQQQHQHKQQQKYQQQVIQINPAIITNTTASIINHNKLRNYKLKTQNNQCHYQRNEQALFQQYQQSQKSQNDKQQQQIQDQKYEQKQEQDQKTGQYRQQLQQQLQNSISRQKQNICAEQKDHVKLQKQQIQPQQTQNQQINIQQNRINTINIGINEHQSQHQRQQQQVIKLQKDKKNTRLLPINQKQIETIAYNYRQQDKIQSNSEQIAQKPLIYTNNQCQQQKQQRKLDTNNNISESQNINIGSKSYFNFNLNLNDKQFDDKSQQSMHENMRWFQQQQQQNSIQNKFNNNQLKQDKDQLRYYNGDRKIQKQQPTEQSQFTNHHYDNANHDNDNDNDSIKRTNLTQREDKQRNCPQNDNNRRNNQVLTKNKGQNNLKQNQCIQNSLPQKLSTRKNQLKQQTSLKYDISQNLTTFQHGQRQKINIKQKQQQQKQQQELQLNIKNNRNRININAHQNNQMNNNINNNANMKQNVLQKQDISNNQNSIINNQNKQQKQNIKQKQQIRRQTRKNQLLHSIIEADRNSHNIYKNTQQQRLNISQKVTQQRQQQLKQQRQQQQQQEQQQQQQQQQYQQLIHADADADKVKSMQIIQQQFEYICKNNHRLHNKNNNNNNNNNNNDNDNNNDNSEQQIFIDQIHQNQEQQQQLQNQLGSQQNMSYINNYSYKNNHNNNNNNMKQIEQQSKLQVVKQTQSWLKCQKMKVSDQLLLTRLKTQQQQQLHKHQHQYQQQYENNQTDNPLVVITKYQCNTTTKTKQSPQNRYTNSLVSNIDHKNMQQSGNNLNINININKQSQIQMQIQTQKQKYKYKLEQYHHRSQQQQPDKVQNFHQQLQKCQPNDNKIMQNGQSKQQMQIKEEGNNFYDISESNYVNINNNNNEKTAIITIQVNQANHQLEQQQLTKIKVNNNKKNGEKQNKNLGIKASNSNESKYGQIKNIENNKNQSKEHQSKQHQSQNKCKYKYNDKDKQFQQIEQNNGLIAQVPETNNQKYNKSKSNKHDKHNDKNTKNNNNNLSQPNEQLLTCLQLQSCSVATKNKNKTTITNQFANDNKILKMAHDNINRNIKRDTNIDINISKNVEEKSTQFDNLLTDWQHQQPEYQHEHKQIQEHDYTKHEHKHRHQHNYNRSYHHNHTHPDFYHIVGQQAQTTTTATATKQYINYGSSGCQFAVQVQPQQIYHQICQQKQMPYNNTTSIKMKAQTNITKLNNKNNNNNKQVSDQSSSSSTPTPTPTRYPLSSLQSSSIHIGSYEGYSTGIGVSKSSSSSLFLSGSMEMVSTPPHTHTHNKYQQISASNIINNSNNNSDSNIINNINNNDDQDIPAIIHNIIRSKYSVQMPKTTQIQQHELSQILSQYQHKYQQQSKSRSHQLSIAALTSRIAHSIDLVNQLTSNQNYVVDMLCNKNRNMSMSKFAVFVQEEWRIYQIINNDNNSNNRNNSINNNKYDDNNKLSCFIDLIKYLTITELCQQSQHNVIDYVTLLTGCIMTRVKSDRFVRTLQHYLSSKNDSKSKRQKNKKNDNSKKYVRILVKLANNHKIIIAEAIQSVITPNEDRKYLVQCQTPHQTTTETQSNKNKPKSIIINLCLVQHLYLCDISSSSSSSLSSLAQHPTMQFHTLPLSLTQPNTFELALQNDVCVVGFHSKYRYLVYEEYEDNKYNLVRQGEKYIRFGRVGAGRANYLVIVQGIEQDENQKRAGKEVSLNEKFNCQEKSIAINNRNNNNNNNNMKQNDMDSRITLRYFGARQPNTQINFMQAILKLARFTSKKDQHGGYQNGNCVYMPAIKQQKQESQGEVQSKHRGKYRYRNRNRDGEDRKKSVHNKKSKTNRDGNYQQNYQQNTNNNINVKYIQNDNDNDYDYNCDYGKCSRASSMKSNIKKYSTQRIKFEKQNHSSHRAVVRSKDKYKQDQEQFEMELKKTNTNNILHQKNSIRK